MRTCIFAAHARPLGAKLGGVTKPNFCVRAWAPPTVDPILTMDRGLTAVLSHLFACRAAPRVPQLWAQLQSSNGTAPLLPSHGCRPVMVSNVGMMDRLKPWP
jgi:hypothetical protein